MRLEIICTDDEVLTGKTVNTRVNCPRCYLEGLPLYERADFEKA